MRSEKAWRLLPRRVLRAAENMAIDEAVFRLGRREGLPPTLRFFGWALPTVSLGYFQKAFREIGVEACRRAGVDIVRRPTGGKAVLHDQELTYSLSAAVDHPLFTGDILGTYRVISSCIEEALRRLGLTPEVAIEGRSAAGTPLEAYCFAAPSRYELLVAGTSRRRRFAPRIARVPGRARSLFSRPGETRQVQVTKDRGMRGRRWPR